MLEISVILPIYNGASFLAAVLEGYRRQTLPQAHFEIVIVDDGSTDDGPHIVNSARNSLPVRLFRQRHAGAAAARNLGLFASLAEISLFADDDKIASPELLLTHLAAHKVHSEPQLAVLGHTALALELARNPVMRHVTHVGGQLFSYEGLKPGPLPRAGPFRGGTSCKRQFLLNHGIFNPVAEFGPDDIDFGYRSRAFGLQTIYEPAATFTMIQDFSFRDFCRRQQQVGHSERKFAEHYPTADVRTYCEIDEGLSLWHERAGRFGQFIRWVERIDRLAQLRAQADRPLEGDNQAILDDAYRAAFALCRAKGVAMFEGGSEACDAP